jgi:hypothetical protein
MTGVVVVIPDAAKPHPITPSFRGIANSLAMNPESALSDQVIR